MIWYCDSSALIKRYVRESGYRWFREEQGRNDSLISTLSVVEIASALSRRRREGAISTLDFHRSRSQFARHLRSKLYILLPPTLEIIESATLLIYEHPLSANDAVHLATALNYIHSSGSDTSQFWFVTADDQLKRAAESKGLQTLNPNDYP